MNCPDVQRLLHPYADGELDVVRHVEIEEHLAGCAACAEQEKRLQSLRTAVSSPSLRYRAPAGLRERLQQAAPVELPRPADPLARRWGSSLRLAAIAAGILLLVGASAMIGMLSSGTSSEDRLAEWVIANHVRSLQVPGRVIDKGSSDGHTVKPWFRDKLDFSPQVPDLSPQGYALAGGRLDYLAGRPVASIVYHRRSHVINLFTWPAANDEEKAVHGLARQGFHMRSWQRGGMAYWAISDLNDQELDQFVRMFQEHS